MAEKHSHFRNPFSSKSRNRESHRRNALLRFEPLEDRILLTTVTVDFDTLDTSLGPVSGAALDAYLAGFGIAITDVTGSPAPPDPIHVNADAQSGVPTRSSNVVASSAPNLFEMSETDHSNSYTFVFDTPLNSFAFTRAGRCTPLAFPDWTAVAKDEFGATLDTVGEGDGGTGASCSSPTPPVDFTLDGPGIKSVTIASGSDGFSGRAGPALDDLVLTVASANSPPIVDNPIADVTANEDQGDTVVDLSSTFSDLDVGDSLTLTVTGNTNPSLLSASLIGTSLTLDYLPDQNGAADITIRATDGGGLFVEDTFNVTVLPSVLTTVTVDFDTLDTSLGPVSGAALDAYLAGFGIAITDVTGSPAPPDPIHVNADAQSGVPTRSSNVVASSAPNLFEMSETDHSNSYTFVFDTPLNSFAFTRAGRCTPLAFPDWTAVAKDEFGATLDTVGEGDGGTGASCSSPTPPVDFTLDGPGIKSVTIASGSDGFSGRAGPALDDLVLTVASANSPPIVDNPIADVTANEDQGDTVVDLSSTFSDLDVGDSLTLTVTGNTNPSLLSASLIGTSLTLDYLPDQNGAADITIRATDGGGLFVEDTFNVTVNSVNDVPTVANPIADVTANEDQGDTVVDLSSTFADIDVGDSLTLTVSGNTNPSLLSASLIGTSLTLDYLPDQNGAADITIRATDGGGLFAEETFNVTVFSSQQQLQNLIDDVGDLGLPGGNTNALTSKLNNAINKLNQGNSNSGANQIQAFINQVNALVNSGKLTQAQANDLIDTANAAIASALPGLRAAGSIVDHATGVGTISIEDVQPFVGAAVQFWRVHEVDPFELHSIKVYVANLPGSYLGVASQDSVWIDADAGGYGWSLAAHAGADRMDLFSAVTHEVGHVLGVDHDYHLEVMGATQLPGESHLAPLWVGLADNLVPALLPTNGPRDSLFRQLGYDNGSKPRDSKLFTSHEDRSLARHLAAVDLAFQNDGGAELLYRSSATTFDHGGDDDNELDLLLGEEADLCVDVSRAKQDGSVH